MLRYLRRCVRGRNCSDGNADTNRRILDKLGKLERMMEIAMSSFDDLKNALSGVSDKVSTVKTDVETLLAKLSSPPGGLTAEQQQFLDDAVTQAQGIATSLGAIDAEANPPAAGGDTGDQSGS